MLSVLQGRRRPIKYDLQINNKYPIILIVSFASYFFQPTVGLFYLSLFGADIKSVQARSPDHQWQKDNRQLYQSILLVAARNKEKRLAAAFLERALWCFYVNFVPFDNPKSKN